MRRIKDIRYEMIPIISMILGNNKRKVFGMPYSIDLIANKVLKIPRVRLGPGSTVGHEQAPIVLRFMTGYRTRLFG